MKVSELQLNSRLYPLQNNPVQSQKNHIGSADSNTVKSFSEILSDKLTQSSELKFSAHALRRLEERQVDMSSGSLNRLNDALRQLDAKGSVNSVILMDETAFVVSVKNRTVVTAVDNIAAGNNVFTNIDSVAIV